MDAANVVGSRADGWWKDRAAAASRLVDALRARLADVLRGAGVEDPSLGEVGSVVVVLEGRARDGAAEGESGGLRVVHASASGDDRLVEECSALTRAGRAVTLATADRGLRERVVGLGVQVAGPRQVWAWVESSANR